MKKTYEDNLTDTVFQLSEEYEDLIRKYQRLISRLNLTSPISPFYHPLQKHTRKVEARIKKTESKIHKLKK